MNVARAFQSFRFETGSGALASFTFLALGLLSPLLERPAAAQPRDPCPEVDFEVGRALEVPGEVVSSDHDPDAPLVFVPTASATWTGNFPRLDPEPSRLHAVLIDREESRVLATIVLPELGEVTSVVTHPDGQRALAAVLNPDQPLTGNGTLQIVGLDGVEASVEIGPHPVALAVSRDGRFVVVADQAEAPTLPELRRYRAEAALAPRYREAALRLAEGVPEKLGFVDLSRLLRALRLKDAEDLLETAADGRLVERLTDAARSLRFVRIVVTEDGRLTLGGNLEAFARDRGYENVDALLTALSPHYGIEAIFDELLERGLVAERAADDRPGGLTVVRLPQGGGAPVVVARVSGDAIQERFFADAPDRSPDARGLEVGSVAIAADSSFALATLHEQGAVISIDLVAVMQPGGPDPAPEGVGAAALLDALFLPRGFLQANGAISGIRPVAVAISPDGTMAITANADRSSDDASTLRQGISIVDLRGGAGDMKLGATYGVLDLSPDLLEDTGLERAPVQAIGQRPPADAGLLPRVDPADVTIFDEGCQTFAAIALARFEKSDLIDKKPALSGEPPADPTDDADDPSGSLLILDVTDALTGIDADRPDANGRGGYVPSCARRLGVGGSPERPLYPEGLRYHEASRLVLLTPGSAGGWLSRVPVSVVPDAGNVLAIERAESGSTYDVLLTNNVEIAALSFGVTVVGACGSAIVVDVELEERFARRVDVFTQMDRGNGKTVEIVGRPSRARCSLAEVDLLAGPGERVRIASVKVCGTVNEPSGCRLVLAGLGSPIVPVALYAAEDGRAIQPVRGSASVPAGAALCFRRGDADQNGRLSFGDVIFGLRRLSLPPSLCPDALDFDDDGRVTIADAVATMQFLLNPASPPPPPPGHETCGPDPTEDELGCEVYEAACR